MTTAAARGIPGHATVEVVIPVATIVVSPDSQELVIGDSLSLTAVMTVVRYAPLAWQTMQNGTTQDLNDVRGTTVDDVLAIGEWLTSTSPERVEAQVRAAGFRLERTETFLKANDLYIYVFRLTP